MREIKFRYIFEDIKEDGRTLVIQLWNLNDIETNDIVYDTEVLITRNQYTGLKDKNDVEIYEGDIVVVTEIDEDSCMGRGFSYKGVVSYANSLNLTHYVSQYPTSFCLISKCFYREQSLLFNDRWDYEVIGNIYENPDLFKG